MTLHALGPYFIQLNYHSALAPHSMTLPCLTWSPGISSGGDIATWNGGTVSANAMVAALVTALEPFFNSTVEFDNFIVYHKPLDPGPSNPVGQGSLTGAGTGVGGSWAGAVQLTVVARTLDFNIAKIVMLDAQSGNDFSPIISPTTELTDLMDAWTDGDAGWCGRDGARVGFFVKSTKTLNEALRKAYRYD